MRKRYGVVKRSPPERRTFQGVVYDSLLEMHRAWQLATMEGGGLTWEPHPTFVLCREDEPPGIIRLSTYTADFGARTPDEPHLFWYAPTKRDPARVLCVDVPDGWVEEVKGPVRTGIRRLVARWKAYGKVPLVILTATSGHGLHVQWKRTVVVPVARGTT